MKRSNKMLAGVLATAMTAGMLTACSGGAKQETTAAATTAAETTVAETTAAETTASETTAAETATVEIAADGLKTGFAVVSSMEKSKDAGDADGVAQVDSVAAAVIIDGEGKIVDCVIDTAQTKMGFTKEGKLVDDLATTFKTKKELGDEYGMVKASSIGKEWYQQMDAFEQYVIGKTVDEVNGIAVNDTTATTDPELGASVTIKLGDYQKAITLAAEKAEAIGTQEGDKLGLGISTDMHKSKDAEDGKDGQCQAYSTYSVVTVDADQKITASIIDATQGTVTFDATGKITSNLTDGVRTKLELGETYGMKKASSIGKEWYEQSAFMSEYVNGKTEDEINDIAVDADGKATDADILSGATVSINVFQDTLAKAIESAK